MEQWTRSSLPWMRYSSRSIELDVNGRTSETGAPTEPRFMVHSALRNGSSLGSRQYACFTAFPYTARSGLASTAPIRHGATNQSARHTQKRPEHEALGVMKAAPDYGMVPLFINSWMAARKLRERCSEAGDAENPSDTICISAAAPCRVYDWFKSQLVATIRVHRSRSSCHFSFRRFKRSLPFPWLLR